MAVELGLVGLWYGLALNMEQDEKIKQSTDVKGVLTSIRLYQLLKRVLIFLESLERICETFPMADGETEAPRGKGCPG